MEAIGTVSEGLTKMLKKMYTYRCVREPGFVLEFTHVRDSKYQCAQCKKHGKMRSITIKNDSIVCGKVHPEDEHHTLCKPTPGGGKKSYNSAL